jgi:hypothetical protein
MILVGSLTLRPKTGKHCLHVALASVCPSPQSSRRLDLGSSSLSSCNAGYSKAMTMTKDVCGAETLRGLKYYEFIWSFDSAKMLQISKFSVILTPSLLLDFSVNIGPRPSTERSIFIRRTRRFQCYNANLSNINTNGAITI